MTASLPNRRRARFVVLGAGMVIVAAAACSDVPSDPNTPFSIEFNRASSPSVVLGEAMFDSLGNAAPLTARVFNAKGEEIVGAPVTYHVVAYANVDSTNPAFVDSVPLTVDAATGVVTGKTAAVYATKTARVFAQAGKLQSQTVIVTATRHPDTLSAAGSLTDSLMLSFLNTDSLLVAPSAGFTVRVLHTVGAVTAADSAVPAYLVRFQIVQPASAPSDTSYVMLTNGDRKRSELDTTDASGNASRLIRVRRVNFPFDKAPGADGLIRDTVVVQASAYREGNQLVPGSGITFRLIIKANGSQ
jgi:hypothetical protein